MHSLGIFANPNNPSALGAVQNILQVAEQRSMACVLDDALRNLPQFKEAPAFSTAQPEAILALGGDGTILRAAALAVPMDVPVLGVNFGRVGFMSAISHQEIPAALEKLQKGQYAVDERMLLSCSVNGEAPQDCINEALLYKRRFSGVADINVNIGGMDAGSVYCDGIIVSTPNGSTGYSISAGGPVVAQGLDVAIITPVCPHTLSFRPIVADPCEPLRLRMGSDGYLALDGIYTRDINQQDMITIRKSPRTVKFIQFQQRNIYQLIHTKLT